MKQRHRARRLALQGLCCLDVQGEGAMESVGQFILDSRETEETLTGAQSLLREVYAARERCDLLMARHARNWELGRLALVDRNILRLAVHEMTSGRAPPKVVIAEALRLAQEYSTAESPGFVNGILDAVYKELRARDDRQDPQQGAEGRTQG